MYLSLFRLFYAILTIFGPLSVSSLNFSGDAKKAAFRTPNPQGLSLEDPTQDSLRCSRQDDPASVEGGRDRCRSDMGRPEQHQHVLETAQQTG